MNIDESFIEIEWSTAFQFILEKNKGDLNSILIIRSDQPEKVIKFRQYLSSLPKCHFIKLGISCEMDKIYQILFENLGCDSIEPFSKVLGQNISVIAKKVIEIRSELLIVIDNCQHLEFRKIFGLIGLVLELRCFAQFIFILPDDYYEKWERESVKYKGKLFSKIIMNHYEFQ